MIKKIARFLPVTLFVTIVVLASAGAVINNHRPEVKTVIVTPAPFQPVTTSGLNLLTHGEIVPGQTVTLQNGVCNHTPQSYSFSYTFGIREGGDPLAARYQEISGTGTQPLEASSCWRQEPFDVKLPPVVTPGQWQWYATLIVMGNQAGQVQRVPLTTPPFVVREP